MTAEAGPSTVIAISAEIFLQKIRNKVKLASMNNSAPPHVKTSDFSPPGAANAQRKIAS
jgi:hypothetical protein